METQSHTHASLLQASRPRRATKFLPLFVLAALAGASVACAEVDELELRGDHASNEAAVSAQDDTGWQTSEKVGELSPVPEFEAVATVDTMNAWAALEIDDLFRASPELERALDHHALGADMFTTRPNSASITLGWRSCGAGAPATYVAGEFSEAFPVHGVAGDHVVLFAAQPSIGLSSGPSVHVMRRLDGQPLGELVAPPEGWGVPLTLFVDTFDREGALATSGELMVSDVRIPPAQALVAPQPARLYRYRYAYSAVDGFSSELVDVAELPVNTIPPGQGLPNGIVYLGSFTLLPTGEVLATDTLAGAIWKAPGLQGPWAMVAIDPRFAPAPVSNIEGVQRAPGGGLQPYTLVLPAPPGAPVMGPGIESVTYVDKTDEVCVISNAQGGIYCIARASLLDEAAPPFAKGQAIRTLLPPAPGLDDFSDGLVYDRFHPNSPWLYWHRAPSDTTSFEGSGYNTLRRINLETGEYEVIAQTNTCFDWTYEIAALPPLVPDSPFTSILSSLGQGPNDPAINMTLGGVLSYVSPTLLPVTLAESW